MIESRKITRKDKSHLNDLSQQQTWNKPIFSYAGFLLPVSFEHDGEGTETNYKFTVTKSQRK